MFVTCTFMSLALHLLSRTELCLNYFLLVFLKKIKLFYHKTLVLKIIEFDNGASQRVF